MASSFSMFPPPKAERSQEAKQDWSGALTRDVPNRDNLLSELWKIEDAYINNVYPHELVEKYLCVCGKKLAEAKPGEALQALFDRALAIRAELGLPSHWDLRDAKANGKWYLMVNIEQRANPDIRDKLNERGLRVAEKAYGQVTPVSPRSEQQSRLNLLGFYTPASADPFNIYSEKYGTNGFYGDRDRYGSAEYVENCAEPIRYRPRF